MILSDGQRVPLRSHQIQSLCQFQLNANIRQFSIFIQVNKLWNRPASQNDPNIRIISPLDDERGTMEEAMQRGDKARVNYLKTSLPAAVAEMDQDLVRKLLKFKADVNATVMKGRTSLHLAASVSCMPIVRDLVAGKANIHAHDTKGLSALHCAAQGRAVEACAFLISQRADVNARTHSLFTPLHYSCRGHVDYDGSWLSLSPRKRKTDLPAAVLLILNKADINITENEMGRKPLELVRNSGHRQALLATEAVVHAEASRMVRDCSTQYACVFWDNLCRASRFCRLRADNPEPSRAGNADGVSPPAGKQVSVAFDNDALPAVKQVSVAFGKDALPAGNKISVAFSHRIDTSQYLYPVFTDEAMEVSSIVRDLVKTGADPELLLLSVVDSGGQIDEEFMLQCIDVLQKHGAKGLVAPSNDPVRTAKMVGEGSMHPNVQRLFRELSRLCGRYRLAGRAEHCTETSVVRLAKP